MCGFAGFMPSQELKPKSSLIIKEMIEAIHHRGPDGNGSWQATDGTISLGHKRLAIVDLSNAGHQPMRSYDNHFTIVFNGEIYNHLELREKLSTSLNKNFVWQGSSDTETLLTAITEWGLEAALKRSVGMFAFALWDHKNEKLILARDRMGEKPLYFGKTNDSFIFSSELKSITQFPNFNNQVSKRGLREYLKYNYIPAPWSIYDGIFKLIPGSYAIVTKDHQIKFKNFWSIEDIFSKGKKEPFKNYDEAIQSIEKSLTEAISLQMLADVPLGAFLSGGIDSSTIAAIMQSQSNDPIKTFTIAFEDPSYNEAPFAREIAKYLGTDHQEVLVTDNEAKEIIPKLSTMYDEPFADSSQIPTHLVCKAARQHVTVALSGDAADELFGGYNRYTWTPIIWNKFSWMPFMMRRILGKIIQFVPPSLVNLFEGWVNLLLPEKKKMKRSSDKFHKIGSSLEFSKTLSEFCHHFALVWQNPDEIINMKNSEDIYSDLSQNKTQNYIAQDEISQMMFDDLIAYLPDDILCKVDRAAMSVSLETRVPFLDHRLVEISSRVPLSMKIRSSQGKYILREILYKYIPPELIDRPKAGFAIPVGEWIKGPLREWAEKLLDPIRIKKEGFFNVQQIQKMWRQHQSGTHDWTTKLWGILIFQSWLEKNINNREL
jgi:asparagine synthase (glutamine-hydrolysing)